MVMNIHLLEHLRSFRGRLPTDFHFDRDEASGRQFHRYPAPSHRVGGFVVPDANGSHFTVEHLADANAGVVTARDDGGKGVVEDDLAPNVGIGTRSVIY